MLNSGTDLRRLWRASPPLTATAALMSIAFLASILGVLLDPRTIGGAPAWLKPAKFGISTAIFTGTMAWLFGYLTVWPRLKSLLGWVLSAVLVLEVVLIDIQAARGTTSHFNTGTALDGALFGVMGIAILILWLASVGVLALLFLQRFEDPAWAWALRLGMAITVAGAAGGGLMLGITREQKQAYAREETPRQNGGHTVGAPDGGPGLPFVGWSMQHGDLRIGHFFGLHGVQAIPLLGWLLRRRGRKQAVRLVLHGAASYAALIAILTWQALRGQPVLQPDAVTLTVWGVWLAGTAAAFLWREPSAGWSREAVAR